jgi:hypothetical protein
MEPAKSFNSNMSETNSSRNEVLNNPITVTKCLSQRCTGFYTDSISEYLFIKCLDPKHNGKEGCKGPQPQTTNHNPRAADVTPPNRMTYGGNYNVR